MFLAFKLSDLITIPFGYVLEWLYKLTGNYGFALILFAVVVYMVLLPVTAKSKKSMMKMSRMQPMLQEIQRKYANDQQKQNFAIQQLYKDEGVSMTGGCLWGFVPMLILIPLYSVIRQPITYMLHETADVAAQIVEVIKTAAPTLFSSNDYYDQIVAAQQIPNFLEELKAAGIVLSESAAVGINFDFLGINMGTIPNIKFWAWDAYNWANIGLFLIPCLSAGSQVLSFWIQQKQNNSVITNEKGVQDDEAAKNSQQAQTNQMMMWMMPLMSLWIGFTVPAALSLYWFVGGMVRLVQDVILTKHYRKIYDAEDAERLRMAIEQDKIQAEKERIRAERRAANPDGQTQNTSKKKLAKAEREREAAAKAAAAREYAARKGVGEEEEERETLSGISDRPYCKGRAYDPNRYSGNVEE